MCLENFLFSFFLIEKSKNPPRAPPWEHAENKMPAARPPPPSGRDGRECADAARWKENRHTPRRPEESRPRQGGLQRAVPAAPAAHLCPRPLVLSGTAGHVAELVPLLFTV